jgi:hypothetical protein
VVPAAASGSSATSRSVASGTDGFPDLEASATDEDLHAVVVRVASLDDLIRMKRAHGRFPFVSVEWGTRPRKAAGQEGAMNIGEPRRTIYIEPIEEPPPSEEPIPIAEPVPDPRRDHELEPA